MEETIKNILKEENLDAIILVNAYNIRYISNFSGDTGYIYYSNNKQVILTDSRYTLQAREETTEFEVLQIGQEGYFELLHQLLSEDKARRVGFENNCILYETYEQMVKNLEIQQLIPLDDKLNKLRMIKTTDELQKIKKAEEIGDLAFSKILNVIKPGMTELEITAYLEFFMKTGGAEQLSFDTIVATGVHSSMPHAKPSNKKIKLGDFLTMDFGCKYKGYCSDMTRTIVVGKATEEQKKVYHTVLQAQSDALDYIKAGLTGKEVDKVARDKIDHAGYKEHFAHGLGHSIGLYIHENPRISPLGMTKLLPNMVVTIEPGIYIEGFGG